MYKTLYFALSKAKKSLAKKRSRLIKRTCHATFKYINPASSPVFWDESGSFVVPPKFDAIASFCSRRTGRVRCSPTVFTDACSGCSQHTQPSLYEQSTCYSCGIFTDGNIIALYGGKCNGFDFLALSFVVIYAFFVRNNSKSVKDSRFYSFSCN